MLCGAKAREQRDPGALATGTPAPQLRGAKREQVDGVGGAPEWIGHHAPIAKRDCRHCFAVDEREQNVACKRPGSVQRGQTAHHGDFVGVRHAQSESGVVGGHADIMRVRHDRHIGQTELIRGPDALRGASRGLTGAPGPTDS